MWTLLIKIAKWNEAKIKRKLLSLIGSPYTNRQEYLQKLRRLGKLADHLKQKNIDVYDVMAKTNKQYADVFWKMMNAAKVNKQLKNPALQSRTDLIRKMREYQVLHNHPNPKVRSMVGDVMHNLFDAYNYYPSLSYKDIEKYTIGGKGVIMF